MQYSSLCVSAVVVSLGAVDIGEEVLVRVQVECGREEVNNREKQARWSCSSPEYFSYQNRLEIHVLNLGSNFREDLLFLSFQEIPDSFVFHFAT